MIWMARRKFHFGPQPALDKALAKQNECERALVDARDVLAREKQELAEIERRIAELRQQIAGELDKTVAEMRNPVAAASVEGRRRYVDALREREAHKLREKEEQEEQVRWAAQKLELRKRELAEAMNAVKALEKVKDKAKAEFKVRLRKAEEKERDDIAMSRGVRKRSG